MSIFSKPLADLDASDLDDLVADAVAEGQTIEFKAAVSSKKGGEEGWNPPESLQAHARDKLLKELVAFANADGGWLIVGIAETGDEPPRADKVTSVVACHELRRRLLQAAGAVIEPQIPDLSAKAIEVADGKGVVILRVERSYLAPHRLDAGKKDCYVRRADRTEAMTMREIQDLTLLIDRGTERLKALQAEVRSDFERWAEGCRARLDEIERDMVQAAFRASVVPIWPLTYPPLTRSGSPFLRSRDFRMKLDTRAAELVSPPISWAPRRIIRGWMREGDGSGFASRQYVRADGVASIEVWEREDAGRLQVSNILAAAANLIETTHCFRTAARTPGSEWALDVEVLPIAGETALGGYWNGSKVFTPVARPLVYPTPLPTVIVGSPDLWDDALRQVADDLFAAVGEESPYGDCTVAWELRE